jgi:membrane-bound lytic murein transglycosylase D
VISAVFPKKLVLLCLLFFAAACSSRSQVARSPIWTDEDLANPVIIQEEYEAKKRGELKPEFDIPVVRNSKVERWLTYFQGRGAKWYRVWLERSGRYIPMFRKILRDHGLPEDLVYLAMIESGFNPRAYSRARAVGYWQFIRSTGRLYGLKQDFWRDERRDPEKSALAAARHLKDLYDHFQDWKLAAAAYNAGQGKVSRAIRRYKTEDFWELTKGRYLKRETKNYVPKLIAAALIAKEPEKYGFRNVEYQKPLEYEKVILRKPVNLETLAKRAKFPIAQVMRLNPELNHRVTPPDEKAYELRVPTGSSQVFLEAFNNLPEEELFKFAHYKIRRGDTISQIARRYRIPQREILSLNKIRSARRIRAGQTILLPVPANGKLPSSQYRRARSRKPIKRELKKAPPQMAASEIQGQYTVQSGDTLWAISKRFGVSMYKIKSANGMRSNRLYPGRTINIPGRSTRAVKQATIASNQTVHVVRRGDTLWDIAQQYGTSIRALKQQNGLRRNTIKPGKRLVIPTT